MYYILIRNYLANYNVITNLLRTYKSLSFYTNIILLKYFLSIILIYFYLKKTCISFIANKM